MAIRNKRLKEYIYQNTSATIRSRGTKIVVRDLDFSPDYSSVSAQVYGSTGNTYTITYYGMQFGLLSSTCTCPFDQGNVCKHEVAVANEIDGFVDLPPNSLKKLEEKNQVVTDKRAPEIAKSIEIPFKKIQDISSKLLKQYTANSVFSVLSFYAAQVKLVEYSENESRFSLKNKRDFKDTAVVKIRKKEGYLSLLCSCGSHLNTLCVHQAYTLAYVKDKLPQIIMSAVDLDTMKNDLLLEFGFTVKDTAYTNYFDFDFKKGKLEIIPKNGIVRLSKFRDYEPMRQQLLDDKNALGDQMPFLPKQKKPSKLGIAIGFNFDNRRYRESFALTLEPLQGNIKKDGTALVSKIDYIDPADLIFKNNRFSSEEIEILKLAFLLSDTSLYDIEKSEKGAGRANHYTLTQLQLLVPLLKDTLIYEIGMYGSISRNDLVPLSISMQPTELSFTVEEENDFYVLTAFITINEKKLKLSKTRIGQNLLFVRYKGTAYLNKSMNYAKTLDSFKKTPELRVNKADFENYYKEFILPLSKRYEVKIKHQKPKKSGTLQLEHLKKQLYVSVIEDYIMLKPALSYKGKTYAINGYDEILETQNDITYSLARNKDFETDFLTDIRKLHPQFAYQQEGFFYLSTEDFIANTWFLDAFETLREIEIELFGLDQLKNIKYNLNKPDISMSVTSGLDWFDVSISVTFGDQTLSLKDLKKSVVAQDKYVRLGDGSIGILPEAWLKKYAHLFRSGALKKDHIAVSKYQLSVIDSLYDDLDLESNMVKNHLNLREKLRSFSTIDTVKTPAGIKATLRDYQKEGLNWLNFLDEYGFGGCLADDMGLGKTLQIITFLQHLKKSRKIERAHLIVVPTSLIFNWSEELKKFCPSLSILNMTGSDRSKKTADFNQHNLVITTYGTLLRDIALLKEHSFEYIILDESQAIKNPNSKRYKAVRMLQAQNRLVLTGTPIENNTFDLYAQMTFVNPGLLGTIANFKSEYATAIDKNKDANIAEELRQLISPFLMRRTKDQVAKELPAKTEQILYCTMGKNQRKVYDAYRNKYRNYLMGKIEEEGLGKSKMYVLEGLTKLRQICDSPRLLNEDETYTSESIKIDELIAQVLERTGNHKMLIFSQFVTMLQLIKERLEKEGISFEYLDGKTKNRQEKVANFQNDATIRVFLISLKAGGTGLNLTAADYVYIVDPWWNPAVEAQAIDRCYRIGQDKKVMAYKMICKDTIEEKIVSLQASKKQLSSDIIQTDESFVKSLSKESIADLFG